MIGDIGIKAELMQAHDTIARLRKQEVKTWDERDAFAERIDARDKEANDMQAQLQAANAVCEGVECRYQRKHGTACNCPICRLIKAWRATQKGGG